MTCFLLLETKGLLTTHLFEGEEEQAALFKKLKALSPPKEPLLSGLYAEQKPGRCALCEGPLPKYPGVGRRPRICRDAECKRKWHTLHRAALKAVRRAAAATERAMVGMNNG
jgi:hypothetical protein